jgi:dihydropyrimidinase
MRILVCGGKVALHTGVFACDLVIEGGRVTAMGSSLTALGPFDRTIDATGRLILPGLIDAHVHLPWKTGGLRSQDDFASGTRAAAWGGVTTVIDLAIPVQGESLLSTVRRRREEAEDSSYTDFSLHAVINYFDESLAEEIPRVVQEGMPSFKLYMLYPGLQVRDGEIYQIMQWVKQAGGLVGVHAENGDIIDVLTHHLVINGKLSPPNHYSSRPAFVETEAIQRVLFLNRVVDGRLYFVHVSTGGSLVLINKARQEGQRVYAETCPHYLLLTAKRYEEPEGHLFLVSPSLKTAMDREALWKGVADGGVDFISTDHCPFSRAQKERYKDDFTKVPNGLPGVEARLPLLVTEGYWHRHMSLERIVQLTSYNPARIFGLYPRKGTLQVGSDADLVVFNLDDEFTLSNVHLHSNVDWSPYEGYRCRGRPELVMRRGEVLWQGGEWVTERPRGEFIPRWIDAAE